MPGLRRLCRAEGGAAHDARARRQAREHSVRQRHRLLVALPLLYGDLRLPHHPRPRAGGGDGGQARQSRSRRVDHHRRRRRALDRRQPHDAPAAPQSRLPVPAVQQRDLRAHQGPIFADLARRHALAFDAVRLGRSPRQPLRLRAGIGRAVRGARDRRAQESRRDAQGRARAQGRELRRDLPELHRLQRRRLRGLHRQEAGARQAALARAGQADAVRGRRQGPRARYRRADAQGGRCRRAAIGPRRA